LADDLSRISQALPDYEVERELGRGGMGVVLLGHHRRLGRAVAIKELPQTFASEPDIRERFTTEARTLATLSHPHIVPVYDYVERGALCLIVMEELPGGTVWERFTTIGLTPPAAAAIVLACCAALQHAHDKGVLHLDVKPDNLMFDASGTIKVTDFGISRMISGDRLLATVDGQVLGTPAYMSPEQARGENLDASSDVYSAGVMLYELLSGRLPWSGAETASELLLQRLEEDPKPLRELAPHVPEPLAGVVMKALARDRKQRFARAEDFGMAIASACADSWGPTWLDHAGVLLIGSDRLSMAARTTSQHAAAASPQPQTQQQSSTRGVTGAPAPGTVVAGGDAVTRSPETVHSGEISAEMAPAQETIGPQALGRTSGAADVADGAVAPPAPAEPNWDDFKVVRAAAAEPRIHGADLNALSRADLVDMRGKLQAPDFPKISLIVAVVALLAAIVAGFVMFGADASTGTIEPGQVRIAGADVAGEGPVEIDLSENVPIEAAVPFVDSAELKLSVLGVPLGSMTADLVEGRGEFEPDIVAHLAAGNVDGELTLSAAQKEVLAEEFPVKATNPWYTTAFGIVSLALILAGIANLETNLRNLRRRRRTASIIGAGIAGALATLGVVGVLTATARAEPTVAGTIVVVVLGAVAVAGAATAIGVLSRRRRVNKAVKRAVRDLGVQVSSN
jgi:serine/threonine-protein kinase